ncbi:MAG: hypothetical protein IJ087_10750 [Eggerthellaceae bacterium]|nr:hypothetical protein [Eggerthellaceae bacterium]
MADDKSRLERAGGSDDRLEGLKLVFDVATRLLGDSELRLRAARHRLQDVEAELADARSEAASWRARAEVAEEQLAEIEAG